MNKVYIVCEPARRMMGEKVSSVDLTPAADWGETVILLQSNQAMLNSASTIATLHQKLRDFCDDDYLVPIGDPVLMCTAAMIAAYHNNGRVKMLKWDRIQRKYISIPVFIQEQ